MFSGWKVHRARLAENDDFELDAGVPLQEGAHGSLYTANFTAAMGTLRSRSEDENMPEILEASPQNSNTPNVPTSSGTAGLCVVPGGLIDPGLAMQRLAQLLHSPAVLRPSVAPKVGFDFALLGVLPHLLGAMVALIWCCCTTWWAATEREGEAAESTGRVPDLSRPSTGERGRPITRYEEETSDEEADQVSDCTGTCAADADDLDQSTRQAKVQKKGEISGSGEDVAEEVVERVDADWIARRARRAAKRAKRLNQSLTEMQDALLSDDTEEIRLILRKNGGCPAEARPTWQALQARLRTLTAYHPVWST